MTGNFVTKDHGFLQPYRPEAAVIEVMQVGSANAAGRDLDLHFSRIGISCVTIFNAKVSRFMNDDCFHVCLTEPG